MAWYPEAVKKPLAINFTRAPRPRTDAVILHVAVSVTASLFGWFSNPRAAASSHFYIRLNGIVEQYIDTDHISWAGVRSDQRAISIETAGMGNGTWTQEQLDAIDGLLRWLRAQYPGIAVRQMQSSKASEPGGIGYHSLGVPATTVQKLARRSQTGGELWSGAVGKICPGPDRVRQVPGIVARLAGGAPAPKPKPDVKPVTARVGVKTVQQQLRDAGYYKGIIDGQAGPMTAQAVLAYQKGQRYFPGLLRDGNWGDLTQAHFEWVKRLQTALNGWKTASRIGKTKIDGDYGPFADRLVRQTITDNFHGAYTKAVKAVYGWRARPVNDGVPGRAFCHMINIPAHPTA